MNRIKPTYTKQDDGTTKMTIDLKKIDGVKEENGHIVVPFSSLPCLIEGTNIALDWDKENKKLVFVQI